MTNPQSLSPKSVAPIALLQAWKLLLQQRLASLFKANGKGGERRWTLRGVIDCLAQITRNKVTAQGVEFYQNSTPTVEQQQILDLLGIKM